MEPRPPSRRDTPTIAVPSPSPELNGQGPSGPGGPGSYGTTAPFDPYTAPEAQSAYGPTAGYPGDSATRLGPLADEPVFYPNPGLPPNRPAYQPAARYDARSEYALHPVGRVPPDHQPLNLRPAPPPMAPTLAPPNHNNLIKGILAGVIGLIAVAALVAAFLTFANGGFGGNNDAPPATTAAQVAGLPSNAVAAGVASPSAAPSVTPSGTVSSGAPVVPPASSQAPSPSVDAAPGPAAASVGASAGASASGTAEGDASAQPAASGSARPGGSAQPSGSAVSDGASASGGDIAAFLPPPADLPGGFDTPSNEGGRSLSEVAGTFVAEGEDAAKAQSDLEGWGWQDNQYVVYDAAPQPPDEDVNRYAVSVHQFETAAGATDALPAFVRAFGVDPVKLPADTPKIGDDIVAIQTTNPEGNLAVLYVRSGAFVLKIDAASVTGDPLPAALELARQLVG